MPKGKGKKKLQAMPGQPLWKLNESELMQLQSPWKLNERELNDLRELKEWQKTIFQPEKDKLFCKKQEYQNLKNSLLERESELSAEISKYTPTERYPYHYRNSEYQDLLNWEEEMRNSRNRPAFEESQKKLDDFKADAKRQLDEKNDEILALEEKINRMGKDARYMFSLKLFSFLPPRGE